MNVSMEEFAQAVIDWLYPTLPDELAGQADRFADADAAAGLDVPLVAPDLENYYPGGVQAITRYPTIEVAAPDWTAGAYSLEQEDADLTVNVVVKATLQHARMEILYRQTTRMQAAIYSALVAPGAFADARITSVRGAIRFNPETEELDAVVSAALLVFTIASTQIRA